MKLQHFKFFALLPIVLTLIIACADDEKLTPPSVQRKPIEINVGEDPNFVSAENNDNKNGRVETVSVKRFSVNLRYSNDFEGDLQLKLFKGNTAISQSGIFHKKPSPGNPDQLDDATFSYTVGKDLELGQSYSMELHCTNYSNSATTQLYWWSSNSSVYVSGTGMRNEANIYYSTNADFSFKIEALNDSGVSYVILEQSVKQKTFQLNSATPKIYLQTFILH